jgi:pimeloyl-ACP methyl ester carboxylesterase
MAVDAVWRRSTVADLDVAGLLHDVGRVATRVLSAADAYQAMTQRRPHRPELAPDQAAQRLRNDARVGLLDAEAVAVVLATAGHGAVAAQPAKDPTRGVLPPDRLATVAMPVLLTTGADSDPVDHAIAARLTTALPRAHHVTLPGARHVPHHTHPDEFARVLGDPG